MKRLKKEFQALADDFVANYEDTGCCCHQSPPCGYCTHPGHPENLAETPEAWIEMLEPMCEGQEPILLGDDTPALQDGDMYYVEATESAIDKLATQYDGESYWVAGVMAELDLIDIERVFGGVV